ncbi:leucine-rich repeat domain-containing protein [Clostridium sp. DSM 17811]|uniref:leucine-rich repeat domain-containing protein n=1 Tax=Clostridium sp. DSM 17811 TaxID=2843317 RepID=UPI001C0DA920|nr:leucine-rich repeat domain-containing protein [Clostridium sp. DSM 17811]MBU3101774.1 leucine-rich repeat domain-containing protein [Clostridium sp. DSM 17811]
MKKKKLYAGLSKFVIAVMVASSSVSGVAHAATGDIINTTNERVYDVTYSKDVQALISDLKDGGADVFLKEGSDGKYYSPSDKLNLQSAEIAKLLKAANVDIKNPTAIKTYIKNNAATIVDAIKVETDKAATQTVDTNNYTKVPVVIDTSNIVTFPDKEFEKVIRDTINKPTGDILKSDVDKITELSVSSTKSITSILGIENLTNLTILELNSNKISNLEPLQALTKLTEFSIAGNQISNIKPLKGLTNLISLDLSNNQISNIEDLRELTNLTELSLRINQITDYSPVSSYYDNLKWKDFTLNNTTVLSNFMGAATLSPITVQINTIQSNIGLPNNIDINMFSNGFPGSATVSTTWDNGTTSGVPYDSTTPGTYIFTGSFDLPDGMTNYANNPTTITVPVIVKDKSIQSDILLDFSEYHNEKLKINQYISSIDNAAKTITLKANSPVNLVPVELDLVLNGTLGAMVYHGTQNVDLDTMYPIVNGDTINFYDNKDIVCTYKFIVLPED